MIDPAVMDVLGITPGDIVEIEGKKRTAVIAWPGLAEDTNKGIVRIDGTVRRNADVGIDEKIALTKGDRKGCRQGHCRSYETFADHRRRRISETDTERSHPGQGGHS